MRKIKGAEEFQNPNEPDLRLGDLVYLNSGSPILLVTDYENGRVTVGYKEYGVVREMNLPRMCFHRVRDAW